MKKLIGYIVILLLFVSSCTIKQEYHFNSDFSGKVETSVDLTSFIQFMDYSPEQNSMDFKDSILTMLSVLKPKYEQIGAKNFQYGYSDDDKILRMSYEFSDIEALNKILSAKDTETQSLFSLGGNYDQYPQFERKGKNKLKFKGVKFQNDTLVNSNELASMRDYYKYEIYFYFDKKIKSVDNKRFVISDDKKSAKTAGSLFDFFEKDIEPDCVFKIK